jgi:hypothetical protein
MLGGFVDVVVWLGAVLLVAAGALKLRRPVPAALFVRRLGIPASPLTVRALAVVEAAVGLLVLTVAGAALVAAAGLYAAFLASLAAYRLRTGERTVSCGCFGGSAPVAVLPHAAALLVALAATTAATLTTRRSLMDVLGSVSVAEATLLLVLLALAVVLVLGAAIGTAATPGPPAFRTIGGRT